MRRNLFLAVIASVMMAFAAPAARAATIVDGDFSAGGLTAVPPGWTANTAYLTEGGFNKVTDNSFLVPPGFPFALSIGNFNSQPIPVLSQVITTTPGATYTISFLAMANAADADSRLNVFVDTSYGTGANATPVGGTGLTVTGSLPYTLESFSFVGTGSDTLSIAAYNNPAEYLVGNVTISGGIASGVPEASSWMLMIAGFACVGLLATRGRRGHTLRLA